MGWWVWAAIQIVSALLIYALTPKPKAPEAQKAQVPVVKEGTPRREIFGTVCITDPQVLAHKELRTTPIKAKAK